MERVPRQRAIRLARALGVRGVWGVVGSISEAAIKAAVSFVELCLQHACYLGGRGDITEEIEDLKTLGMICTL